MSYDLVLFHLTEGQDPDAKYQEYAEQQEQAAVDLDAWMKRPVPQAARTRMQGLSDALRRQHPALEQFQPERSLPWIELNHEDLQVQVTIGEQDVGITTPYFRERASESVALIQGCLKILSEEGGFVAYDPQLGRVINPDDTQSILTAYNSVDGALPDILKSVADSEGGSKKPWWKFW